MNNYRTNNKFTVELIWAGRHFSPNKLHNLLVSREVRIDKKKIKSYGTDYLVAATAAAFPWIFCVLYFIGIFHTQWKEALLIARFAAPTSAGVLFAMLAAAGLGTTWLFRKAQVLAIFDDLDTVLLMIPLQILLTGMKSELIYVLNLVVFLLAGAYFWLHRLKWPVHHGWLMVYGILATLFCEILEHSANVHLEVLLPSFALGCLLYNSHNFSEGENSSESKMLFFDRAVKGFFMFLVGCSLPKISLGEMSVSMAIFYVLMLTVLANLGKCFPGVLLL